MARRIGKANATSTPLAPALKWIDWLPLGILPVLAITISSRLPPWAFMWLLAFSIYCGLKWLTWSRLQKQIPHARWRSLAYLLAWPGMDVRSFLSAHSRVAPPRAAAWLGAISLTTLGAVLFFLGARALSVNQLLLCGWVGMIGLVLILHFGSFKLLALFWQSLGVNAVSIMSSPLSSRCVSEFWGRRWNLGFRDLAHQFVFLPVRKKLGVVTASFLVFIVSGLIHDLVISLPARGGYGLPTVYFVIQGIATALERSRPGKLLGLRQGWRGRLYMTTVVAGPAFLLFHPPFVLRVVIPCMKAVHAL